MQSPVYCSVPWTEPGLRWDEEVEPRLYRLFIKTNFDVVVVQCYGFNNNNLDAMSVSITE